MREHVFKLLERMCAVCVCVFCVQETWLTIEITAVWMCVAGQL